MFNIITMIKDRREKKEWIEKERQEMILKRKFCPFSMSNAMFCCERACKAWVEHPPNKGYCGLIGE